MFITVLELKQLYAGCADMLAAMHIAMLNGQKLGYKMEYDNNAPAMDTIIFENLVRANELSLDSDYVTVPDWCSADSFAKFISKMNGYDAVLFP